jgi:hypothetical protein
MASEHMVGDVVEHLWPVDDPTHGLVRRFSSPVIALIVEGSRDVGGHRFWNPEELVGSAGDVNLAMEKPLMQNGLRKGTADGSRQVRVSHSAGDQRRKQTSTHRIRKLRVPYGVGVGEGRLHKLLLDRTT